MSTADAPGEAASADIYTDFDAFLKAAIHDFYRRTGRRDKATFIALVIASGELRTLAGDALKGLLPVLAARLLDADDRLLALTALAAFLGHLYPVFFGFRGGKGVATAFGALIALSWPVALALLGVWLLMARVFRISSLAALAAAVTAPLFLWWLNGVPELVAVTTVISLLLIWRHRSNIRKLLDGTEGL